MLLYDPCCSQLRFPMFLLFHSASSFRSLRFLLNKKKSMEIVDDGIAVKDLKLTLIEEV